MKVVEFKSRASLSAGGRSVEGVAHVAEVAHGLTGAVRHVSFCLELTDDQLDRAHGLLTGGAPAALALEDGRRAAVLVDGFVTEPAFFAVCGHGRVERPAGGK